MPTSPLDGYVVVDLSTGIPGAYAGKVLADGGADVVTVEPPEGDPLRRWSSSGAAIAEGDDGPLFQYLSSSKRSVAADPDVPDDIEFVRNLVASADAVIWSRGSGLAEHRELTPERLREVNPGAIVTAITPFGLAGPWADRVTSEGVLQAMAGSPMTRGDPDRPPVVMGGRIGDFVAGMAAAIGTLTARWRNLTTGAGELVDVSAYESLILTMTMYPVTFYSIAGMPMRQNRVINLPAIHATKDGYVGFMVVTGQQWLDFCVLVDQAEWMDDESLLRFEVRNSKRAELVGRIDAWMAEQTVEEVLELASALRIPAAEVGTGATIPHFEQLVARNFFVRNPRGGFLQPDVPYAFHGADASRREFEPAPRLGEHNDDYRDDYRARKPVLRRDAAPGDGQALPFAGLRVADFTNNWAGPIVGNYFAMYGADVIHVESPARPDPIRYNTIRSMQDEDWWEWSPLFHGPNAGKRDLTLDLSSERGRELALKLIAVCDVVVENYSPRVMENFGLGYEDAQAANPAVIMVRCPAWGISGPWRDRTGYAQTMEMASGLAWLTGWADAPPEIPNGPMDPIAGQHATIALLLALEHRRRTGQGMLVEASMIGGALNIAAEQVIEHSASGVLLGRDGNRSRWAVPQGAYQANDKAPVGEVDRWVFISVETDDQWDGLRSALGDPDWMRDPSYATAGGRRTAQDALDRGIAEWCAARSSDQIVDTLVAAGVPVGKVLQNHEPMYSEQLAARRFYENLEHPLTGSNVFSGYAARLSEGPDRLNRTHPPLLGQDNVAVLKDLLGCSNEEIAGLEAAGVIGTRPGGAGSAW